MSWNARQPWSPGPTASSAGTSSSTCGRTAAGTSSASPAAAGRAVAVDLLDPADTRAKVSSLPDVTHLFYAAYQDRPTWAELVAPNLAMLTNLVDALDVRAASSTSA